MVQRMQRTPHADLHGVKLSIDVGVLGDHGCSSVLLGNQIKFAASVAPCITTEYTMTFTLMQPSISQL